MAEISGNQNQHPIGRLIVLLGSLTAMAPLAIDMYLPAFPGISETFHAPLDQVQLSLASFFVGVALGQLVYGPAADRFGRRKPLFLGLIIYFASSLFCAFAPNIESLIVARFFQALGACSGMVMSRAIVRDLFGYRESARVFSLLMLVMGVAPILAPLLGTFLTDAFGWRSVFYVQTAFSFLCTIAAFIYLPETRAPSLALRLRDILPSYVAVLKDRKFLGYSLTLAAASSSMFAYITGSPFVFLEHFRLSNHQYGWLFGTNALGFILVAQLNAKLLKTRDPDSVLGKTLLAAVTLALILLAAGLTDAPFLGIAIPLFCYMASLGMVGPNAQAGALANQKERAGTASALLGTFQFGAAALVSGGVSALHNRSLVPMTGMIGLCAISALAFHRAVARR